MKQADLARGKGRLALAVKRKKRPTMPWTDDWHALEKWRKTLVHNHADDLYQITQPMPPIVCTVTPPCGHCWYCLQHKAVR